VLAVLVTSQSTADFQNQIANTRTQLMVKANKEVNNILYFFSLGDVKLKEQKITGYCWHKTNKMWFRQDFPFPDVLYIKCKMDNKYRQTFAELCSIVTKNNGELITHTPFDKWRLYQIMYQDPVMKSYLPVTRTAKQRDDIEKMLKRFKVVYLKSHVGRKGENVIRVELLPDGVYRYSYYRYGLLTARSIVGYPSLLKIVKQFFRGKQFMIQQGIELLRFNNQLIDMRAELQRSGNGSLDIVGISVRYGKPGSPITTHGEAIAFDDFFVKNMGCSKKQLETLRFVIEKFLFSVYEYIDNHYGRYAEIGIDFAMDAHKNIWFIEANSQSAKVSLKKAYGKKALYRYYKNIMEYARYLSDGSRQ
jgi:hypothetical protein